MVSTQEVNVNIRELGAFESFMYTQKIYKYNVHLELHSGLNKYNHNREHSRGLIMLQMSNGGKSCVLEKNLLEIEHEKFMDNFSMERLFSCRDCVGGKDISATLEKIDRGVLPNGSELSQKILKEMKRK